MSELFSRLVGILLLKNGPQDLPRGTSALTLAVAGYVLATAATMALTQVPNERSGNPAGILALAVILPLVLVRIVLQARRRPERWVQTLTALFGTGAVLSLISLPLAAIGGAQPGTAVTVATLVVFFWSFAVDAHIWRHALEISFAAGLVVTMVLFAISMYLITTIAGPL